MAEGPPAAQLLISFIRADERQSLFLVRTQAGDFQIIEDAELWEEPREQGEAACYHYYPTMFSGRRFADLDSALSHARRWFPWISDVEDGNGGNEPVIVQPAQSAAREG
jgi:hypothetical protein